MTGSVEETSAYLAWLMVATRNLIARANHWRAIEALAAQLLLKTTIPGKAARSIILEALFPKFDASKFLK